MSQPDIVEMVHVSCDLCGGETATSYLTPVASSPGMEIHCSIVTCDSCGFIYTSPRPVQRSMPQLYQSYYTASASRTSPGTLRLGKRLKLLLRPLWHWYCGQYLSEVVRKASGAVLDVGCGTGDLLEELANRGCRAVGLDINTTSIEICRKRGLLAVQGDLDILSFPAASFDTIILWHVLEHIPSPRKALERIHSLLRPGGKLLVYCPNAKSYLAQLFGPYWSQWHLPFHFHHFTESSIRALARLGVFTIYRIQTVTPEFLVAYSLDLYHRTGRNALLRLLLRTGIHHTLYFRLAVSPVFRFLDWCMRGRGECLQVEMMKPEL